MPRPKNLTPSYCRHELTNTARMWLGGRWVSLGRYNSPESRAEYARRIAELAVSPAPSSLTTASLAPKAGGSDLTVAEVCLAFLKHAEVHYRLPDGKPTSELYNFKLSLRHLRDLYGHTPAREFGPLALKAVRAKMVNLGWCRSQINKRANRIRHVFKWAASEELVPASVFQALRTVAGLQAGRTTAVERGPVKPVDDATVDATLPFLSRHVRGLVEFQRLTGCRPGEACVLRRCDIDTSGPVWLFRPTRHKTAHRGKARAIAIGPKAQTVLERFPTGYPTEFVFSPAAAVAELHARRAAERKTPRYPSSRQPRAAAPKRVPKDVYGVAAYGRAVRQAAEKAGVPHWHPNQLRHSFATAVRKQHGLEAAQVLLGHAKADVSQVYAEKNEALAVAIAGVIG